MTLGALKGGDIVLCDRKGRRFYAIVVERHERELEVEPIDRRVTYRRVKAREVIGDLAQEPRAERPVRKPLAVGRMSAAHSNVGEGSTVVVNMRETISSVLVGHDGIEYESPPQSRAQALALVQVLLGRGIEPPGDQRSWTCPLARGQRTVTLRRVSSIEPPGEEENG